MTAYDGVGRELLLALALVEAGWEAAVGAEVAVQGTPDAGEGVDVRQATEVPHTGAVLGAEEAEPLLLDGGAVVLVEVPVLAGVWDAEESVAVDAEANGDALLEADDIAASKGELGPPVVRQLLLLGKLEGDILAAVVRLGLFHQVLSTQATKYTAGSELAP